MVKHFIARQFRKPTGFFGSLVGKLMAKGNLPAIIETTARLELVDTDTVLEIGYGPGLGISQILSTNLKCTMKGIDFSEQMYKTAFKKKQKIHSGKSTRIV